MGLTDIQVLLSSQLAELSAYMRSHSIQRVPVLYIDLYDSKASRKYVHQTFHMLIPVQGLRTPSQFTSPVRDL
jgi:hypothetical protein